MDLELLLPILVAVAVFATIVTLVMPMLATDKLGNRMKSVALERSEIRARERAAMKDRAQRGTLREKKNSRAERIAEKLDLRAKLTDGETARKMRQAGMRGQNAMNVFLVAKLIAPLGLGVFAAVYVFGLGLLAEHGLMVQIGACAIAAALGFYLPDIYVSNISSKRHKSIMQAWPDALDLTLICVESGMSIEAAFRKVSEEIGMQSVALAEELTLTCAELSFLPERRQAYENLVERTGVEAVKNVIQALVQAEKYGTPVGQALRVLAQESRDDRMTAAEKKAHALPPKLTVPMIVFFVPVLFIVIMGPPIMQAVDAFAAK